MKLITKLLVMTFLLFTMVYALPTISHAAVPHLINYQGKLLDSFGKPVTGTTKKVTFSIYNVSAGGTALWSETYPALSVNQGVFSCMLGGITPLNLAFDQQYYLGIQVESDPEMSPRQYIASAGYAIRAENVTGVVSIANGGTGSTNAANGANGIVILDTSSRLPAVDGSQLASISFIPNNAQVFVTPGTSTWTKPTNVSKVYVKVWGAGGGGGGAAAGGGAGGGGGGYAEGTAAVMGNVTVIVGAGGTAGANGVGGAGGLSSFAGSTVLTANGGSGGYRLCSEYGAGGTATNGLINVTGFSGFGGLFNYEGSHGGSAFLGGAGGVGGEIDSHSVGKPGTFPGGGGGGSGPGNSAGGAGANGCVIVYY